VTQLREDKTGVGKAGGSAAGQLGASRLPARSPVCVRVVACCLRYIASVQKRIGGSGPAALQANPVLPRQGALLREVPGVGGWQHQSVCLCLCVLALCSVWLAEQSSANDTSR
jgi:hypothetical protein